MSEVFAFALWKIQLGEWVPVELVGKAGVLWAGLWSTRRVVHQRCPQEAAGLLRSAQLSEGDVHKSTGRRTSVHQAGEGVRGRRARTLQAGDSGHELSLAQEVGDWLEIVADCVLLIPLGKQGGNATRAWS
jgi:hypothetical protein